MGKRLQCSTTANILEGNTILIKVDAAAKIIENHDKEFVSVKGNKKSKSVNSR